MKQIKEEGNETVTNCNALKMREEAFIPDKMSRNKDYQRLLNSKRWKQLRAWKLNQQPLCELCEAEGYVRSAIDVHHIDPCESARTLDELEAKCFNPANLQSLCISCHTKLHREAKSHTKEVHKQREDERLARWIAKHEAKAVPNPTAKP